MSAPKPFEHQVKETEEHGGDEYRGIFWEQGTGKSKLTIMSTKKLLSAGKINGLVIVSPAGMHYTWALDELPTHAEFDWQAHQWLPGRSGKAKYAIKDYYRALETPGLAVLSIYYEALLTEKGWAGVQYWLKQRRCMLVWDESLRLKSPSSKITRRSVVLRDRAPYRRILVGVPAPEGPTDLYGQMNALKPGLHGHTRAASFKSEFCEFEEAYAPGGRTFPKLVGYRNLDRLQARIAPYVSRVKKDDCLDLPPKIRRRRVFEMPAAWQKVYDSVANSWLLRLERCESCKGQGFVREYIADWDEELDVTCEDCGGTGGGDSIGLAITRLQHLRRICRGHVRPDPTKPVERLPGPNPALDSAIAWIEEADSKGLIWCHFREDMALLSERLTDAGMPYCAYRGAADRPQIEAWRNAPGAPPLLLSLTAACRGLTLVEGKRNLYYSMGYKLEERLQSEDRTHRIGQDGDHVLYDDLVALNTCDEKVSALFRQKEDLAHALAGDRCDLTTWIKPAA